MKRLVVSAAWWRFLASNTPLLAAAVIFGGFGRGANGAAGSLASLRACVFTECGDSSVGVLQTPTRPVKLAGVRIEPPPSLAVAKGTIALEDRRSSIHR